MSRLTFRQLRVFVAAADTLSFVKVAATLGLTPSAVSFQIKQIEMQIGFDLFERIGRKVALTEAGNVLLAYARPVLRSLGDVDQAMLALKGVGVGRVRLGLVSTAKYIVPHIIARFRTLYPGVMVQLREGNRAAIVAQLSEGALDLAIMGQPPEGADVEARRFAAHPQVLIASPGHRLCAAAALAPSALAAEWFVMREEGSGTRALSDRFFRDAGFMPRVAMETSSNEMIKQAVIAGMGLAIIGRHTISLELSLGLLATLPVRGFPVERSWFLVHRRTSPLLPVQTGLRDYLMAQGPSIIDEICLGIDQFGLQHSLARPGGA
jgi:DNA-binding transcriptional LysR family regulator